MVGVNVKYNADGSEPRNRLLVLDVINDDEKPEVCMIPAASGYPVPIPIYQWIADAYDRLCVNETLKDVVSGEN